MVGKYPVITLCGSTKFKDAFMEAQKRLTLEGNIVISVGLFGHSGDDEVWDGMDKGMRSKTKEILDDMHKRKIDMADEIYVINVGGYVGESTISEIRYAAEHGKMIKSLEYLSPLSCKTPDELACEMANTHILDKDTIKLLKSSDIIAFAYSESGAMGGASKVAILCMEDKNCFLFEGYFQEGVLSLNDVLALIPDLKLQSTDSNWAFEYMGCGNHLYIRKEVYDRLTKKFQYEYAEDLYGRWKDDIMSLLKEDRVAQRNQN